MRQGSGGARCLELSAPHARTDTFRGVFKSLWPLIGMKMNDALAWLASFDGP